MKEIYRLLFVFISIGLIASCKPKNNEINSIESMVSKAEFNVDTLSENDWTNLNQKIQNLEDSLTINPNSFSKEEKARIAILKSRYVDILKTKEANDFNQRLDEWSRIILEGAEDLEDSLTL